MPALAIVAAMGGCGTSGARPTIVFAGGGLGGQTYATLTGLAHITRRHAGLDVRVIPGGGLISLVRVGRNNVQAAVGNLPFIKLAVQGQSPFDQAYPDIRTMMQPGAGLNVAHLVAAQDLPVDSLADVVAKRYPLRIAVDRKGTTDNWILNRLLGFYGATTEDLVAWGGSVREVGYPEQSVLMTDGHIDALFQNSPVPSSSLVEISFRRPLKFLSLPPDLVDSMVQLSWTRTEIAREPYARIAARGPVVSVGYTMPVIVNATVADDVVYRIVKAICEHPAEARAVHRSWREFEPRSAWQNTGGALHPGAARYFKEKGYMP
jgi:hypothetical protein